MSSPEVIDNGQNKDRVSLKELVIGLQKWCHYFFSKWKILSIALLAGGLVGATYAFVKKPVYTAACTFVLEGSSSGGQLAQYAGLASMMGVNLPSSGSGIFQNDNIIELYLSRKMVQKTLLTHISLQPSSPLLIERYIEFNKLYDKWKNIPQLKNIRFDMIDTRNFNRLQDSLLRDVYTDIKKNYLSVTKLNDNVNMIKVEVKATDEIFAKAFNDNIVKNVNDFYVQTKTKILAQNIQILQHQTDSVKSVLNGAITTMASVTDATPNLNPTRLVLRVPAQRSQFNAEANKAILSELVKNLELAKISFRKETPLIEVVDTPAFPLEKTKLGIVKAFVIGAMLSIFFTVLILFIREQLRVILMENNHLRE